MTEVTEWNGKPRYMWCWDYEENKKVKDYVLCILTEEEMKESGAHRPVSTVGSNYNHCAEIEEEPKKETRLTYYEISQLLKCFGVELNVGTVFYNVWNYSTYDKELPSGYTIRYKQGEWEEPTRETVWKWWGEETPNSDIARFVSFIGWDKE